MACFHKALRAVLFFTLAALTGCDSYYFHSGRFWEARRRYSGALQAYEKFLERSADIPRAAQAHVLAGDIYAARFGRCLEARRHYEAAYRLFPKLEPWASRAQQGIMSCPDYFPLRAGLYWRYGDTQSKGRNMRLDWAVKISSDSAQTFIANALFAGSKRIRAQETRYEKKDWAVWEYSGSQAVPILRYPFKPGQTWKARRGKDELLYRVDDVDAQVRTEAGLFKGCLKIREFNKKFPGSWKYDYYAPFVGKVKTTIAGPDFENSNTELIEYR